MSMVYNMVYDMHAYLVVQVKCPRLEVISGYVEAIGRGFCASTPLLWYVSVAICVP